MAEFESRVHELRDQMGMAPLVEKGSEQSDQEEPSEDQEEPSEDEDSSAPFDPFEAVENPEEEAGDISVSMPEMKSEPEPEKAKPAVEPVKSVPIPELPPEVSPIQREMDRRSNSLPKPLPKGRIDPSKIGNTLETAHVAHPSVQELVNQDKSQGVVEESKINQPPVSPPKIDPPMGNKNPRFAPRR